MRHLATLFLITIVFIPGIVIAQAPVEIWYGNPDGSPMVIPIGAEIQVPVFIRTSPDLNLTYASIMLGRDDQYLTSYSDGNLYPPLPSWLGNWFEPFPDSPEVGKTSDEWTALNGNLTAPLHFESPTMILEFNMTASSNPDLIGQTVSALSPGYNPNCPIPEERWTFFIDENYDQHYPVEHYSQITFVDTDIPTLSEWGMILLGLLLLMIGTVAVIRRRKAVLGKAAFFAALILLGGFLLNPQTGYGDEPVSDDQALMVPCGDYVLGDFDGNSVFETVDYVKTVHYLFAGAAEPVLMCECTVELPTFPATLDVSGDCLVNISDIVRMISNLRHGTPPFSYCPECPPGR